MTADFNLKLSNTEELSVPQQYTGHPLLRDALFFVLPVSLLDELEKEIGEGFADLEAWKMERELANVCGYGSYVGFWRLRSLQSFLLRPTPAPLDSELAGLSEDQRTKFRKRLANVEKLNAVARGFAGWLLTNRTFLTEQTTLFRTWKSAVDEHGLPQMGSVVQKVHNFPGGASASEGSFRDYLLAFEGFFIRWRLKGMAAPSLPDPLPPYLPVPVLKLLLGHMQHGGKTFYIPDTFPIPSRDEFRDIVEDALRGGDSPEHLDSWTRIVRAKNAAKNEIPRFARLFQLQHYWRALYQRHGENLQGRTGAVQQGFATFLNTSLDTIRKDLRYISGQLGEEWFLPDPLQAD